MPATPLGYARSSVARDASGASAFASTPSLPTARSFPPSIARPRAARSTITSALRPSPNDPPNQDIAPQHGRDPCGAGVPIAAPAAERAPHLGERPGDPGQPEAASHGRDRFPPLGLADSGERGLTSYFLLAWVSWTCPGGWLGGGLVPRAARPLICQAKPEVSYFSGREAAVRKVHDLGPDVEARLLWCRGLRCWERSVKWSPVLEVSP